MKHSNKSFISPYANIKHISTLLILSLTVSSCGIFKPFKAPIIDNTGIVGNVEIIEDDIVLPTWRDIFTDPLLQDLIETALNNNTDLQTSELKINSAKAAVTAANLAFLPRITFSPNGLSGELYFDLFGKFMNNQKSAEQEWYSSQAYSQIVRTNLISSVAATYYTLQMLDNQLEIGTQSLDNWKETEHALEVMKLRDPNINEAAVLQAKAQRLSLESSLISIKKSIAETQNEMCSLLAMEPQEIQRSEIESISLPKSLCDSIPFKLVIGRPDVQYALHKYAKAYYITNVAKSGYFPQIAISGKLNFQNEFSVANSSSRPLINAGALYSSVKTAKAEQEIARLEYEQSLIDAGIDVNNALITIHSAQQKAEKDDQQVSLLQDALHKTELLMKHSTVNYLEVLTAEQTLLNAKQALAEDNFNKTYGLILLYQALGGGAE